MNYKIELTETENKAMQYIAYDVQDWIDNVVKERARIATDEIVKIAVEKFLEAGQSIPGSKDDIVSAAYSNGWIQDAKQKADSLENKSINL